MADTSIGVRIPPDSQLPVRVQSRTSVPPSLGSSDTNAGTNNGNSGDKGKLHNPAPFKEATLQSSTISTVRDRQVRRAAAENVLHTPPRFKHFGYVHTPPRQQQPLERVLGGGGVGPVVPATGIVATSERISLDMHRARHTTRRIGTRRVVLVSAGEGTRPASTMTPSRSLSCPSA